MPRYIDAEKLEKDGWWASRAYQQDVKTNVYETKKMTDFPAADVVEIVRCKDCKWFNDYEVACDLLTGLVDSNSNDYCSKGERKETEDATN